MHILCPRLLFLSIDMSSRIQPSIEFNGVAVDSIFIQAQATAYCYEYSATTLQLHIELMTPIDVDGNWYGFHIFKLN